MNEKLLVCVALAISLCRADAPQVKQMLESALADSGTAMPGADDPALLRLESALGALAPSDLEMLMPTAMRCVRSPHPQARWYGMSLLVAALQTPASAALFDRYISDFDAVLSDPTNPDLRTGVIATLEITRPTMSPKAIQLFLGHLQDKANTPLQTGAIAAALLRAAPSNPAIAHQALSVAENRSEHDVKYPILKQIGLSKIQLPEVLDFLDKELDDPVGRGAAMHAVSYQDRDVRARFVAHLSRIAQENPDLRTAAEQAIQGH